jgi:hypothetical protein
MDLLGDITRFLCAVLDERGRAGQRRRPRFRETETVPFRRPRRAALPAPQNPVRCSGRPTRSERQISATRSVAQRFMQQRPAHRRRRPHDHETSRLKPFPLTIQQTRREHDEPERLRQPLVRLRPRRTRSQPISRALRVPGPTRREGRHAGRPETARPRPVRHQRSPVRPAGPQGHHAGPDAGGVPPVTNRLQNLEQPHGVPSKLLNPPRPASTRLPPASSPLRPRCLTSNQLATPPRRTGTPVRSSDPGSGPNA